MEVCDYSHLILYAKGYYKRGDVLEDVKKILGHRCAIDAEHLSNMDVWGNCVHAFIKYCNTEHDVGELLVALFKPLPNEPGHGVFDFWSDSSNIHRAIHAILVPLMRLKVFENGQQILELGKPNPTILPLTTT